MHERKQYPNLSDEELDRRAEEALQRMLANPAKQQQVQGQNQNQNQGKKRHRRRHK